MKVVRCVFVLMFFSSRIILAQTVPTLVLASPSDGTVIQPGQTLTVEVKGPNLPLDGQETITGGESLGTSQAQPAGSDLVFQLTIPSELQPGSYALWAVMSSSVGDTLSHSVALKYYSTINSQR